LASSSLVPSPRPSANPRRSGPKVNIPQQLLSRIKHTDRHVHVCVDSYTHPHTRSGRHLQELLKCHWVVVIVIVNVVVIFISHQRHSHHHHHHLYRRSLESLRVQSATLSESFCPSSYFLEQILGFSNLVLFNLFLEKENNVL